MNGDNCEGHRIGRTAAATLAGSLCAACTTIAPPPPLSEDTNAKPLAANATSASPGVDPYIAFNRALFGAQAEAATNAKRVDLLNEGLALVNYRCNRYFAVLGKAEQDLRFTRKQTTLTSGFVLSALGLAGATTKAVANVGALFSFGTASMDSYEGVYLFSPDVKAVQRLVANAMGSYREKLIVNIGPQPTLSYTSVVGVLSEYESFCEPHGIRDLVNQSLAQVKTTADASAPAPAPAPAPAVPAAAAAPPPPTSQQLNGTPTLQTLPRIDVRVVPR